MENYNSSPGIVLCEETILLRDLLGLKVEDPLLGSDPRNTPAPVQSPVKDFLFLSLNFKEWTP
jgi:hypothetical protein